MNMGIWCRLWLFLTPLFVYMYFKMHDAIWLVVATITLECFLFEVGRAIAEHIVRRLRSSGSPSGPASPSQGSRTYVVPNG